MQLSIGIGVLAISLSNWSICCIFEMGNALSHCMLLNCTQDTDNDELVTGENAGDAEPANTQKFSVENLQPINDITQISEDIVLLRAMVEQSSQEHKSSSESDSQQSVLTTISPTKDRLIEKR